MTAKLLIVMVLLFVVSCGSGDIDDRRTSSTSGSSLTSSVEPMTLTATKTPVSEIAATASPSPQSTEPDPTSTVRSINDRLNSPVDRYPYGDSTDVPTETTVQFRLFLPQDDVAVSLTPLAMLTRVALERIEQRGELAGAAELYLFRPTEPLAPNTRYEVTVEIDGAGTAASGGSFVHSWSFVTGDGSNEGFGDSVPLALLPADPGPMNAALLSGILHVEGSCLYLLPTARVLGEDSGMTLPLLEDGTVWWEGDLLFHRGSRYRIGDEIRLGGGEVNIGRFDQLPFVQRPDASCDVTRLFSN